MPASSPAARALQALELIQLRPGIPVQDLADRLGVTERAARRYVANLRAAGIPVESTRGRGGGYRLGRGVRLPPLHFGAQEALALVMAVLDGHHDVADPESPVGAAVGRILRALPAAVAAQAQIVRRDVAPAPDRSAARPDPAMTAALVSACSEARQVRLGYRTESGRDLSVVVEPWFVVVRHARWYLLCRLADDGDLRAYRVDRVHAVTPMDIRFEAPTGIDPVAALEAHLSSGWAHAVTVTIDAPVERLVRCMPAHLGRLIELDERTTRLEGSTNDPIMYAQVLANCPAPFRIVHGDEVRAAVRALGDRLVAATAQDVRGD